MKNNHGFSNILIIILVVAILGVAGFLGYNFYSSNKLPDNMPSLPNQLSSNEEQNQIIASLKQDIENSNIEQLDSIVLENNSVWWITNDGYSILTTDNPAISINIGVKSGQKISNTTDTKNFERINLIVKNKMLSEGFRLNELNSNSGFEGASNKDYIDYIQAYEKPGLKCVEKANRDIQANQSNDFLKYDFACTTDAKIDENYKAHAPFIDLITNGIERNTYAISSLSIEGERASAGVQGRRSGAVARFYNEGNIWKLIHIGQSEPDCSALEKRGVPKKFQEGCIN
jgi:hypothetical protein